MKTRATYTVHVTREDGSVSLFPVSPNVVSLRAVSTAKKEVAPVRLVSRRGRIASAVFSLFLMAFTLGGSPVFVGATLSYFRDDEVSRGNTFAAASLAFDLNPGEVTEEITLGEPVFLAPKFTPDDETLPIMYRVSAEIVGETTPLCSQLMANGTTSPFFYTGQLTSLVTEPATTTGHGLLEVTLASADGIAAGAMCTVDIVYRGWHQDSLENSGYTDEERDRFAFVYVAAEVEATEESVQEEPSQETPAEESLITEIPAAVEEPEPAPLPEEETPEPDSVDVPQTEPEVQNFSPSGNSGGGAEPPTEDSQPMEDAAENAGTEGAEKPTEETLLTEESVEPAPEEIPAPAPEPTPPADTPPPPAETQPVE